MLRTGNFTAVTRELVMVLGICYALVFPMSVYAYTLEFPDLGLTATANDVRAWARENQFERIDATAPMEEAYQQTVGGRMNSRNVLSFAAGPNGLNMLSFDQFGILNATASVRREIVHLFGKPSADQILPGQTLRITYLLTEPIAARRIFLISQNSLSMLLVSEPYFAELAQETAAEERAEASAKAAAEEAAAAAAAQAETDARNAWLVPLLWILSIGFGGFVLIRLAPEPIRRPVVKVLSTVFGGVFNLASDVLFPIALGITLLGAMIFSGLMVGASAVERGTSWWWVVPWLIGFAMEYKAQDEGDIRSAILALAIYVATFFGVLAEQYLFGT